MKAISIACLCTLILACSACAKNEASQPKDSIAQAQAMMHNNIGLGTFTVLNDMLNKGLNIQVLESHQSQDGVHYFQIEIKNNGNKSVSITLDQFVLVDMYGHEKKAGLIDYDLTKPIEPHEVVKGMIAFEKYQNLTPVYLKLKNI